jgi:DNA-binding response OmpR family regulator
MTMDVGARAAGKRPILVVEDDEDTVAALRLLLADEGYDALAAPDARQAVEVLAKADPGLVLLDWSLDDGCGEVVLSAARAGVEADLPVVLMTGQSSLCARAKAADAVLRKPFDIAELLAIVARFYRP